MSVLTQPAPRQARETEGFAGGVAALAEGKLYALQNPFALDGRVSSYPASARGYSVANSYLLTAGARVGYAWDRLLVFANGGFASTHSENAHCSTITGICDAPGPGNGVVSNNRGWYAGLSLIHISEPTRRS